jgi:hypothetical protein
MVTSVRLPFILALSLAFASAAFGMTTRNDDSCDISVAPAATLLLPYFEVALEPPFGATTLFTVTNVTPVAEIARVTLWTDYSYPVFTFDLYLTGYDVQSIHLTDLLVRGLARTLAPPNGPYSVDNPALDAENCGAALPALDAELLQAMQRAFTQGRVSGCNTVGGVHQNAVGYATIDVVGNCSGRGPLDAKYFTEDIRYDNALIGDYAQVDGTASHAEGSPMVHIRAIPEGGTPASHDAMARDATRLPRTFYQRFQISGGSDARQPLPSTFAARWIQGGSDTLQTSFKVWRQGVTDASARCAEYKNNGELPFVEIVAYDEHENGEGNREEPCCFSAQVGLPPIYLPSTSLVSIGNSEGFTQTVVVEHQAGWVYLNLDEDGAYLIVNEHQNWVVVSMRAANRLSVDFDAAFLGNGCSPAPALTGLSPKGDPARFPGPLPDVNP